jgi:N-acetylmuramoyl-L-alanine amidase
MKGWLNRVLFLFLLATGAIVFPVRDAHGAAMVLLDPAHGGGEKGVKLQETIFEKDITLAVAQKIQQYLTGYEKVRIELTRTSDQGVPLSGRIRKAQSARADLFISLHVNAGFGRNATGFEVYFPGFKAPHANGSGSSEIVRDMVRTQYLNESVKFARILQKEMEIVFPKRDRGLREAPVRILRELTIPAVLLEMGFATETRDRKDLLEPGRQKAVAEAVAKSILEYFR